MVTQGYESVERMVHKLCWRFVKRFRLDYDDCLDAALQGYMRATDSHDPSRGASFQTHVWNCVSHALYSENRGTRVRRKLFVAVSDRIQAPQKRDSLGLIVSRLSDDAQTVVDLIADTSTGLMLLFSRRRQRGKQEAIRDYLWERDWSMPRITATLSELRSVFSH